MIALYIYTSIAMALLGVIAIKVVGDYYGRDVLATCGAWVWVALWLAPWIVRVYFMVVWP